MRGSIKCLWISLCFISVSFLTGYSNNIIQQQYQFKYLSIDDGLSHGKVQTVVQDHHGYIWLGTQKGINRYDGYDIEQFTTFAYNDSVFDIRSVNELILDKENTLWAATSDGLLFFDVLIERFVKYVDSEGVLEKQGLIYSVKVGENNTLWASSKYALIKINLAEAQAEVLELKDDKGEVLTSILECFVQSNGDIWVGFSNRGCGVIDGLSNSFTHYESDPLDDNSLGDKRVHCFYEDGSGNVWLGQNDNGISIFDANTKTFKNYFPDTLNPTSGRVKAVVKDNNGKVWVGTMAGLYEVDTNSWEFNRYAYSDHLYSTLSHSSIQCMYIDQQEMLWIGTYSGGVNYTSLIRNGFYHYKHSLIPNKYFLSQKDVTSVAVDRKGQLWAGTESGGLNCFNLSTGEYTYYKEQKGDPDALQSNNIKSIEVTPENNLWIGTYNGGLSYFNAETKTFKTYTSSSMDISGLATNRVYSTLVDRNGNLWVGTSKKLCMLPYGGSGFVAFSEDTYGYQNAKTFPYIISIIEDTRGWIWLSGHQSMYIYKPEENAFYDLVEMGLFTKRHFESVVEDESGDVWFDAGKGTIVRYNSEVDSFKVFAEKDNIPQVHYSALIFDNSGNLWATSEVGLFRFNNIINSQDSITYNSYGKDDGLQSKYFYPASISKSDEGVVFVGGINGFNSFSPNKIRINPYEPKVVLTKLEVNNQLVKIGEKVGRRKILKQSLVNTQRVVLHSQVKVFSFEFSGLHYVSPDQNKYQYKLEGYDDDWITVGADNRTASYSNLPAGNYLFMVKAANNDEVWSVKPIELALKVRPPFYKTKLFIVAFVIVVVLGVYMAVKRREQKLKADKEKLEISLAEGKAQLKLQKDEITQQQEEIRKRDIEEKEIRWFNKGLAKFSDIITNSKESEPVLCNAVISNLVEYVDAQLGAIYLLNDSDPDKPQLEFAASFAYHKDKKDATTFFPGEGYVGTCFLDKKVIILDDLPDDYLKIKSGLGELSPNYVVLIPMKFDNAVNGVIEIGSFNEIEQYQIEFIEKVAESATSLLTILKSEHQAKEAVDIANQNTEEMKASDEELRQNLEELTAIQEELNRKQEEFKTEQAMFHTLMDFLQDRITFKDPKSVYLRINKIKAEALNLSYPTDAIGKSDLHFFGEEHFNKAFAEEKKIFYRGVPILDQEELIKFDDGTVKWGSTSRVPFKVKDGEGAGTLIITKDITQQKTLEGENVAYKELVNLIGQEYSIVLYKLDSNFNITEISGNALLDIGLDVDYFIGKKMKQVFGVSEKLIKKSKETSAIKAEFEAKGNKITIEHKVIYNAANEGYICCGVIV